MLFSGRDGHGPGGERQGGHRVQEGNYQVHSGVAGKRNHPLNGGKFKLSLAGRIRSSRRVSVESPDCVPKGPENSYTSSAPANQ